MQHLLRPTNTQPMETTPVQRLSRHCAQLVPSFHCLLRLQVGSNLNTCQTIFTRALKPTFLQVLEDFGAHNGIHHIWTQRVVVAALQSLRRSRTPIWDKWAETQQLESTQLSSGSEKFLRRGESSSVTYPMQFPKARLWDKKEKAGIERAGPPTELA